MRTVIVAVGSMTVGHTWASAVWTHVTLLVRSLDANKALYENLAADYAEDSVMDYVEDSAADLHVAWLHSSVLTVDLAEDVLGDVPESTVERLIPDKAFYEAIPRAGLTCCCLCLIY